MFWKIMDQCFVKNDDIWESQGYKIYLSQFIGKGNFGSVYKCERKNIFNNSKELLCAKIVDTTGIGLAIDRVKGELDILDVLEAENNENLVKTYYRGFQDNYTKLFIIMERCSHSLQFMLEQNKKFSEEETQDILYQIIIGYSSLYKHNIIHRDLKPENILIKEANGKKIYKIADFGAAKKSEINVNQTLIGTPVYSAPEFNPINQNDQELMKRSEKMQKDNKIKNCLSQADVYSLGIIAYQLYFSKLPFQADYNGIQSFFQKLKVGLFSLPLNFNRQSQNIQVLLIQQAIQYYPENRITFESIFVRTKISLTNFKNIDQSNNNHQEIQLQPPQNQFNQFINKMEQQPSQQNLPFLQTDTNQQQEPKKQPFFFNNKSEPSQQEVQGQFQQQQPQFGQQQQQFCNKQQPHKQVLELNQQQKPNFYQNSLKNFQQPQNPSFEQFKNQTPKQVPQWTPFQNQIQPQQNLNINLQTAQMFGNFMNQPPNQNPNKNQLQNASKDQVQNLAFPQEPRITANQQSFEWQRITNQKQILVNFANDALTYLEQQINQNQPYFTEEAKAKFQNLMELFQNKDIQGIKNKKDELLKMIIFDEKNKYSLEYLKFSFILLSILKNGYVNMNQFIPIKEVDLRQRIIQLQQQ